MKDVIQNIGEWIRAPFVFMGILFDFLFRYFIEIFIIFIAIGVVYLLFKMGVVNAIANHLKENERKYKEEKENAEA